MEIFTSELVRMAIAVAVLSFPALLVAVAIGLVIAIFQAATQIQEQTLPQIGKIVAVGLLLVIGGGLLAVPLVEQARRLFTEFPAMVN